MIRKSISFTWVVPKIVFGLLGCFVYIYIYTYCTFRQLFFGWKSQYLVLHVIGQKTRFSGFVRFYMNMETFAETFNRFSRVP